jgi:hypothetical protein
MGFIGSNAEMLFWKAKINGQIYLSAWNGRQWSNLRVQTGLNSIKDPVTFSTLTTGCHQLVYRPDLNQIEAVFCDVNGNQDIWFTSMKLGALETWFPPPSGMALPEKISTAPNRHNALNIVAGKDGSFYALWIEPDIANNASSDGGKIVWDGDDCFLEW